MKVGDYVRTKFGQIGKLDYINEYNIYIKFAKNIRVIAKTEDYKSSPNIIDLIEVGDYVNGHKVVDIAQAPKRAVYTEEKGQIALIPRTKGDIKSIVTKEQFESMEYRIGE